MAPDSNHKPQSGDREVMIPPVALPPAWVSFLRFCEELKFGEIERLSIQDGLPVLAEMTKKKIKFTRS